MFKPKGKKALELIAELEAQASRLQKHRVLAPIPEGKQRWVTTLIEGTPYRLKIPEVEPGWWLLRPVSDHEAQIVGEPPPHEVVRYLAQLPAIRVIAVYRLGERSWLVYPWNAGDAFQRGWPPLPSAKTKIPQPRSLQLVTAPALRPFDVLVARMLDGLLLFDEYDRRTLWAPLADELRSCLEKQEWAPTIGGLTPELQAVLSLHRHRFLEEEKRRLLQEEARRRRTLRGRLESALAYSGAQLKAWTERGEGYEVVWEHEGEEYRTVIRPDLFVESAGICLSGRDSDYNLAAIVHVMRRARERGRLY
jgi:hypothetical protein